MKRNLLLLDNEENILHALERAFEGEGYDIFTATSSEEAMIKLSQHTINVIISEQNLSKGSGTVFFKEVKKRYPETVRIILSASHDFNAVRDAINDGEVYKFLSKPWDEKLLKRQIQEAFQVNAAEREKEQHLIRLINYSKLNGIITSTPSIVTELEVQNALDENQFVVYYQPIYDANNKIVSSEALLRWQHPRLGLLIPDQFIPFCEEKGFILPVGAWILRKACLQLKHWHTQGHTDLSVAINVSAQQFNHPSLLDTIYNVITDTRLPPSSLELEITETLIMSNVESNIVALHTLRSIGVKLALDDFGTGFSSLSYLKLFPIDILKIDKSFIYDITTDQVSLEIVTAIISLGKSLKLSIVAEGIETSDQLAILKSKQCDWYQGYFFSKPIPVDQLDLLLTNQK